MRRLSGSTTWPWTSPRIWSTLGTAEANGPAPPTCVSRGFASCLGCATLWAISRAPAASTRCVRERCRRDAGRLAEVAGSAMKRHGHRFEQVVDYGNPLAAAHRARRGKREHVEVICFVFRLGPNLLAPDEELRSSADRMRPYRRLSSGSPNELDLRRTLPVPHAFPNLPDASSAIGAVMHRPKK